MADKSEAPAAGEGQPGAAPPEGTTVTDPNQAQGQAQAGGEAGTSPQAAPGGTEGDTFFDPKNVPAELQKPYGEMRAAFTKGMQKIGESRKKIDAYDAFMSNPIPEIQRIAGQYGYQLTPAGQQSQAGNGEKKPFQPESWDDVFSEVENRMLARFDEKIKPLMTGVQKLTTTSVEQQLSSIDASWQTYEDEMKLNLQRHPTLVNDVALLYRMSVPEEILTSRAVQQALKKFEEKAQSAVIQGNQGVSRTAAAPKEVKNFNDAVNAAKDQLRSEGRYR